MPEWCGTEVVTVDENILRLKFLAIFALQLLVVVIIIVAIKNLFRKD